MLITNKVIGNHPFIQISSDTIKKVDHFRYMDVQIKRALQFYNQQEHLKSRLKTLCEVTFGSKLYLIYLMQQNKTCIYQVFVPSHPIA